MALPMRFLWKADGCWEPYNKADNDAIVNAFNKRNPQAEITVPAATGPVKYMIDLINLKQWNSAIPTNRRKIRFEPLPAAGQPAPSQADIVRLNQIHQDWIAHYKISSMPEGDAFLAQLESAKQQVSVLESEIVTLRTSNEAQIKLLQGRIDSEKSEKEKVLSQLPPLQSSLESTRAELQQVTEARRQLDEQVLLLQQTTRRQQDELAQLRRDMTALSAAKETSLFPEFKSGAASIPHEPEYQQLRDILLQDIDVARFKDNGPALAREMEQILADMTQNIRTSAPAELCNIASLSITNLQLHGSQVMFLGKMRERLLPLLQYIQNRPNLVERIPAIARRWETCKDHRNEQYQTYEALTSAFKTDPSLAIKNVPLCEAALYSAVVSGQQTREALHAARNDLMQLTQWVQSGSADERAAAKTDCIVVIEQSLEESKVRHNEAERQLATLKRNILRVDKILADRIASLKETDAFEQYNAKKFLYEQLEAQKRVVITETRELLSADSIRQGTLNAVNLAAFLLQQKQTELSSQASSFIEARAAETRIAAAAAGVSYEVLLRLQLLSKEASQLLAQENDNWRHSFITQAGEELTILEAQRKIYESRRSSRKACLQKQHHKLTKAAESLDHETAKYYEARCDQLQKQLVEDEANLNGINQKIAQVTQQRDDVQHAQEQAIKQAGLLDRILGPHVPASPSGAPSEAHVALPSAISTQQLDEILREVASIPQAVRRDLLPRLQQVAAVAEGNSTQLQTLQSLIVQDMSM
eukprot:TRINITY_DN6585_c0_g1_i1.p1 TRINITY_DN6585_c0_g1~~TRINITY_DN6585_c0_g1_i1.p1  ORF type:complete len:761 (+),score=222.91 TRINITY_DN6585_c0_g1_i1:41-2323(+)